ncbi:MAG: triose-phosphate isomerase, partial [Armatimonadetes bacterium]|nr:triose-phosphate isomerase [Armatimonadota bacterium]
MPDQLIAGNWKMHGTVAWSLALVEELKRRNLDAMNAEVCICPPFTALYAVHHALRGSDIKLGAQDVFWKEQGAYTSQISPTMLTELGVSYVIIGHSETRGRFGVPEPDFTEEILRHFGENDATVNLKIKAALLHGITPIVCVGETLAERQAGRTDAVIEAQVRRDIEGLDPAEVGCLVFAYEPVWAIGTGEVCDAPEANRVCARIRRLVAEICGQEATQSLRVLYGGSVKPDNAHDLLAQPHIDGALVGGASLDANSFAEIVSHAHRIAEHRNG